MSEKVIIVDDDQLLLNTLERNLCTDFEVSTATGGEASLKQLAEQGPFAVAIVDMQMPDMDGIQTIQAMRAKQENLSFIMLTGNQDSATAIQAMNVGRVFRFLNKPSNVNEITQAITDAVEEGRAKRSAHETMMSTFRGSINMLNDLAKTQSQSITEHERIFEVYELILTTLAIPTRPEDKMLCRLLLIGAATLNQDERSKLESATVSSPPFHNSFVSLCTASAQMVRYMPKFEKLSTIIGKAGAATELTASDDESDRRAMALRIAFYWSVQAFRGMTADRIIESLKVACPLVERDDWSKIEVLHEMLQV